MSPAPAILFDLDGTLVDTAPDLAASMNVLLTRRGRPELPLDHVRHMVGRGAGALMERAMAATGEPAAAGEIDGMYDEFIEHYGEHIADTSRPFPGVPEALARLEGAGCAMGVCTNKPGQASVKLLDILDLSRYFETVVGGDTLAVRKPDPEHVLETMRRAGGHPDATVMVGDSQTDVAASRAAGIPVIAVSFGYTPEPVATFGPDRLIDHFDELDDALRAFVPLA